MKHKTARQGPEERHTPPTTTAEASAGSATAYGGGTATVNQFPEAVGALLARAFDLLESQARLIEALSLPARRGRRPGHSHRARVEP